jgi:hypothetical protein
VKVLPILQMEMQLMKEKEQLMVVMVAERGLSVTTLQMAIMFKMWAGKWMEEESRMLVVAVWIPILLTSSSKII